MIRHVSVMFPARIKRIKDSKDSYNYSCRSAPVFRLSQNSLFLYAASHQCDVSLKQSLGPFVYHLKQGIDVASDTDTENNSHMFLFSRSNTAMRHVGMKCCVFSSGLFYLTS